MKIKKGLRRTIRIKVENSSQLQEYESEMERWVDEGGNTNELSDILSDIELPLKKGQLFKVLDGEWVTEDDGFYYKVGIKLLDLY